MRTGDVPESALRVYFAVPTPDLWNESFLKVWALSVFLTVLITIPKRVLYIIGFPEIFESIKYHKAENFQQNTILYDLENTWILYKSKLTQIIMWLDDELLFLE